jgi:alpha-beta hydrolase superfamily lysophospholipase
VTSAHGRRAVLAAALGLPVAALAQMPAKLGRPGTGLRPPEGPRLSLPRVAVGARVAPARRWSPADGKPWAAAAFSHGANSEAAKYDQLGAALAEGGVDVLMVTHEDSPAHPGGGRVERAAGYAGRIADVRAALDWQAAALPGVPLLAAGHSYGALVAQVLGGAAVGMAGDGGALPYPGLRATLAWSPPGPFAGLIEPSGWAAMRVPAWVATGTADALPPMMPDWRAHRASFENATVRPRLLWVGDGVDHYFGNMIGRPERAGDPRQAALFEASVESALAFARGVTADRWERADAAPAGVSVTLVR